MTPGHSTLELVKHDETATAPERDNDATAFELDASRFAPEVGKNPCNAEVHCFLLNAPELASRSYQLRCHKYYTIPLYLSLMIPLESSRQLCPVLSRRRLHRLG